MVLTAVVAVLAIEFLARVYVVIKLRDAYYFIYGEEQVRRLWKSFIARWRNKDHDLRAVVASFGGSTTSWGGISEKYSYSEILARRAGVKVANCGGEGLDSFGELDALKKLISVGEHPPAMVFVYSGLNDAINARHYEKIIPRNSLAAYIAQGPLEVGLFTRFKGAVKQSSIVYRALRDACAKRARIDLNASERESFLKSRVAKFGQNIVEMIGICRKKGTVIYFGTVPLAEEYKKDHQGLVSIMGFLYVELFKLCKENNAPVIDIDSEVYKLPKAARDALFMRDGIHMNKRGNEFIAKMIYERAKKDGLLHGA